MGLQGRGFFIWKVWDCAGGNAERIASAAQSAGLSHVLIKIADGSNPVNIDKETKIDLVPPVVAALQARGLRPGAGIMSTAMTPSARPGSPSSACRS